MMTAHRCRAPGCGRFVRAGAAYCMKHDVIDAGERMPVATAEAQVRFRKRLERGEYAGLLDDNINRVITQAAKAMSEQGLADEIGALRYALVRLLAEEQDASKLAANVARVASVTVQAARAQRAISGDVAQGLTSALTQILTELDEG